jgi:hypothetical protein
MSDQWHLLQEGQQYGPYSGEQLLQFAQEGRIVRESMVWAAGMENWVLAADVEGLFPPAPAVGPAIAPWALPGAPKPAWMTGGSARIVARSGALAGRMSVQMAQQVGGERYPTLDAKSADFGLVAGLLGGGVALLIVATWLFLSGLVDKATAQGSQVMMASALIFIGVACMVVGVILNYVYLARLWSYLRHGRPRTTPCRAVGLLFVPLFNLYWIFVAVHGLAQDWNRITSQFTDLNRAPKMGEGLFLAYCICAIMVFPVGLILWFPVMAQICRSINFMAFRPVHHPGMLRFG